MLEDLHLVADGDRAVAVFAAGAERRAALADALSWHVTRRFQAGALEAEGVAELRAAGALADRIDEHRGVEAKASIRLHAHDARLLIEAVVAYISERDTDAYQPPEERARLGELSGVLDALFDLVLDLDRADDVLGGASSF
ncbi:MAG: hypothetical protein QOE38_167 [Thermoleophilaceae bacterium]|jgi:hypothetical protein|nr:hypothetical protein [Thermoleophilaceae bacterium]